jgi:glutathione S-transferase
MKLYYSKGSCSLTIRILTKELSIPCEFEAVAMKTKQTASGKDYLSINPKGAVPALELDNGEILTENAVIQQYLCDQRHATHLLPAVGDFNRYRVLEWLNYVSTELHKAYSPLFNPKLPQEVKTEFFIPALLSKLTLVDNSLSGKSYLAIDRFTIADCYLYVILTWLPHFKIDIKQWKNLFQYFENIQSRKSITLSLEEEKQAN